MKRLIASALAALAVGGLADSARAQYPAYGYYGNYNPAPYYGGYQYQPPPAYYQPPRPNYNGPYINFQIRQQPNYATPYYGSPYMTAPMNYYRAPMQQAYPVWHSGQATPAGRATPVSTHAVPGQVVSEGNQAVVVDNNAVAQPLPKTSPEVLGPPTRAPLPPLPPEHGHIIHHGPVGPPLHEDDHGDCCDGGICGRSDPRGGFFMLGGFTFMQPRWQNNPAMVTIAGGGAPPLAFGQQNFNFNPTFSPNVYAGYTLPNGFGGRAHWWWFDQSANANATTDGTVTLNSATPLGLGIASATAGYSLVTRALLEVNVIDGEAITELQLGRWNVLLGGGARYARLSQRYEAWENDAVGGNLKTLISSSRQEGVGPTVVAETARRLGDFGLGLYSMGRGSVLFTRATQNASQSDVVLGPIAAADVGENDVLPIAEIEAGIDYAQAIGRLRLFLRLGAAAQFWFGAGNSSNSNTTAAGGGGPGGGAVIPNPQSRNNLTFFGLNFMTGFQF